MARTIHIVLFAEAEWARNLLGISKYVYEEWPRSLVFENRMSQGEQWAVSILLILS